MKKIIKTINTIFQNMVLVAAMIVLTKTVFDNPYGNINIDINGYFVSTDFLSMLFYVIFNVLLTLHISNMLNKPIKNKLNKEKI